MVAWILADWLHAHKPLNAKDAWTQALLSAAVFMPVPTQADCPCLTLLPNLGRFFLPFSLPPSLHALALASLHVPDMLPCKCRCRPSCRRGPAQIRASAGRPDLRQTQTHMQGITVARLLTQDRAVQVQAFLSAWINLDQGISRTPRFDSWATSHARPQSNACSVAGACSDTRGRNAGAGLPVGVDQLRPGHQQDAKVWQLGNPQWRSVESGERGLLVMGVPEEQPRGEPEVRLLGRVPGETYKTTHTCSYPCQALTLLAKSLCNQLTQSFLGQHQAARGASSERMVPLSYTPVLRFTQLT